MAGRRDNVITDLITCVASYHYADDDRLLLPSAVVADIKVRVMVSVRIVVI